MTDLPPDDPATIMRRWIACMNTMARAAHLAGHSGEDAKAAALIYYACAIVIGGQSIDDACSALICTYQYFRQHPQYAVVDIDSTAVAAGETSH